MTARTKLAFWIYFLLMLAAPAGPSGRFPC